MEEQRHKHSCDIGDIGRLIWGILRRPAGRYTTRPGSKHITDAGTRGEDPAHLNRGTLPTFTWEFYELANSYDEMLNSYISNPRPIQQYSSPSSNRSPNASSPETSAHALAMQSLAMTPTRGRNGQNQRLTQIAQA